MSQDPARLPPRLRRGRIVVVLLALAACEPTFKAEGSLEVEGRPFTPAACHVLAPRAAGIELDDGADRRLALVLPPRTLEAFRELTGTPTAVLAAPGRPPLELGPCGALSLTGEGYHGSGKRAARGVADVECSQGGAEVRGRLTFSGCF